MSDPVSLVQDAAVVVTGGAGFIGSHLVRALLENGARRVVILDSLRTGTWRNVPDDSRVQRIEMDLGDTGTAGLQSALEGAAYLFHLAAEKHNQSVDAPDRVLAVNVDGTFRLFAAAAAAGVRKVVFTSSLYAAGRLTLPPMREDDLPDPRTVYGISKLTGEHLLRHFAAVAGLRFTVFRLFFVYGPRQYAGSGYKSVIVTNFERILRGEAPVIKGDGRQALDYIHVDDVVRALLLALSDAADGEIINIGSASAVTVSQLTDWMLEVAASSQEPVHAPADWTAGTHRVCDNGKAARLLGWTPSVPMREGLAGVYAWMKNEC
ncbi:MAG TPA: NAD-dependent epimerase/dehydratase family protein [Thermoanaerobaculia bacterium]|nr:NAD-dependent epimerase/dehydratase family protein [Thermoanaerobaculia bacterium]